MYSINTLARIDIGRQGETGLRKVVIDCSVWTEAYDGIGIILVAVRPGETEQYMPSGVTISGGILTWVPDEYDTANAGHGLVMIQGVSSDGGILKSAKAPFSVEAALGIDCEVGTAGPAATIEVSDALPLSPALLNIVLQPAQSGSGDPSPENVRPISGATGLTLTHTADEESTVWPVSWESEAGTVYGGTLDFTNGKLTVTHKKLAINADTIENVMDIQQKESGNRCAFEITNSIILEHNIHEGLLCNIAKADASVNLTNARWQPYTCALYYGGSALARRFYFRYVFPTSVTTAEAALEYLVDNGCEITYPLITPMVYHIDPASIKLALGVNTLTTDIGEIMLHYIREVS